MHLKATFSWAVLSVSFNIGCVFPAVSAEAGSFQEMVRSKTDLWGEASLREKNGASYEFFKDLLPPPRYVNSDFRYSHRLERSECAGESTPHFQWQRRQSARRVALVE